MTCTSTRPCSNPWWVWGFDTVWGVWGGWAACLVTARVARWLDRVYWPPSSTGGPLRYHRVLDAAKRHPTSKSLGRLEGAAVGKARFLALLELDEGRVTWCS
eukprot:365621-Chlamydomonas_euryale.AAC.1